MAFSISKSCKFLLQHSEGILLSVLCLFQPSMIQFILSLIYGAGCLHVASVSAHVEYMMIDIINDF